MSATRFHTHRRRMTRFEKCWGIDTGKETTTYNTIVWPLPSHGSPQHKPFSFTYPPMASMWVVTLHSLFLYSDPPLPCHPSSYWLRLFSSQTFSRINNPTFLKPRHSAPTCLWRWNRQSVPKRRLIKFRSRGITQKKVYNIQNVAKVWNRKWFYLFPIYLKNFIKP